MDSTNRPKALGTVLPTAASLALSDAWAASQFRLNSNVAAAKLANFAQCKVGGESRYYASATRYATVTGQRVRWFEVRHDGDYAVSAL